VLLGGYGNSLSGGTSYCQKKGGGSVPTCNEARTELRVSVSRSVFVYREGGALYPPRNKARTEPRPPFLVFHVEQIFFSWMFVALVTGAYGAAPLYVGNEPNFVCLERRGRKRGPPRRQFDRALA